MDGCTNKDNKYIPTACDCLCGKVRGSTTKTCRLPQITHTWYPQIQSRNSMQQLYVTFCRDIQSGNQPYPSASFAFDAKRVKEALRAIFSGNKITWIKIFILSKKDYQVKIYLKSIDFSLLWKLPDMATFIPIISSYGGSW